MHAFCGRGPARRKTQARRTNQAHTPAEFLARHIGNSTRADHNAVQNLAQTITDSMDVRGTGSSWRYLHSSTHPGEKACPVSGSSALLLLPLRFRAAVADWLKFTSGSQSPGFRDMNKGILFMSPACMPKHRNFNSQAFSQPIWSKSTIPTTSVQVKLGV